MLTIFNSAAKFLTRDAGDQVESKSILVLGCMLGLMVSMIPLTMDITAELAVIHSLFLLMGICVLTTKRESTTLRKVLGLMMLWLSGMYMCPMGTLSILAIILTTAGVGVVGAIISSEL